MGFDEFSDPKMMTPASLEAFLDLLEDREIYFSEIRKNFILSLAPVAERYGFTMEYDEGCFALEEYSYIHFYDLQRSGSWELSIYTGGDKVNYAIGVRGPHTVNVTEEVLTLLDSEVLFGGRRAPSVPVGIGVFGEGRKGVRYWDWRDTVTLRDMMNGKLAECIETELLQPVVEHRLLEKIEDWTSGEAL